MVSDSGALGLGAFWTKASCFLILQVCVERRPVRASVVGFRPVESGLGSMFLVLRRWKWFFGRPCGVHSLEHLLLRDFVSSVSVGSHFSPALVSPCGSV